ncbi:hypothetical protein EST38_g14042 [Candolleomyces aberdarensis]|uniref:Uncharacterized protein n=1 Tax=Candolleomyces aberdarensis TaxID=2316362 RepID=A0A4Q2CYG1_9AGAR|nr:hypothetical protein EST38_g14042 [Candolleomyces aberdarensis]
MMQYWHSNQVHYHSNLGPKILAVITIKLLMLCKRKMSKRGRLHTINVGVNHLWSLLKLIQDIKNAKITDVMFPKELQTAVLGPIKEIFDVQDPDVVLFLTAYLSVSNMLQQVYRDIQSQI